MFCPRCAAQNLDDAKFCRGCGTNLETVALALADKYHPARSDQASAEGWLETRRKGIDKIVKGSAWLVSSLLIGAALGMFANTPDWIIIWMSMVGWMAVWGIISMSTGTAGLMESRFLRRQLGQTTGGGAAPSQAMPAGDEVMIKDAVTAPMLQPQASVTEHTTTRLIKPSSDSTS